MTAPTSQQWNNMFRVYAICSLFLYLKYFCTAMFSSDVSNHPEEDKKFLGDKTNPENISRRVRIFANDMENIPFHTALFWGAFLVQCFSNLSGNGEMETRALTVLIVVYCFFRLSHTMCYMYSIQPFRSISFLLANATVAITCCISVASAFQVEADKFM